MPDPDRRAELCAMLRKELAAGQPWHSFNLQDCRDLLALLDRPAPAPSGPHDLAGLAAMVQRVVDGKPQAWQDLTDNRLRDLVDALTWAAGLQQRVAEWHQLAPDIAQLLDGWHCDGTAWSEWDESVRKWLGELQLKTSALLAPPAAGEQTPAAKEGD